MALLDGHSLKSHRVGLAYQPIRGCFFRVEWVRQALRFVWVHLVGLVLPRDAGLAGMALGAAWILGGRLMPPQGC